jgi:hypothetical protein
VRADGEKVSKSTDYSGKKLNFWVGYLQCLLVAASSYPVIVPE